MVVVLVVKSVSGPRAKVVVDVPACELDPGEPGR